MGLSFFLGGGLFLIVVLGDDDFLLALFFFGQRGGKKSSSSLITAVLFDNSANWENSFELSASSIACCLDLTGKGESLRTGQGGMLL